MCALPFKTSTGFVAIPTAVCDYYVKHPRFTPTTERVYRYLLQRYNADYGYAFPSFNAIMREAGIGSKDTVSKALDTLEHLRLIERHKRESDDTGWDNNYYTFIAPIESEAEFFRTFGAELKPSRKRKGSGKSVAGTCDLIDLL